MPAGPLIRFDRLSKTFQREGTEVPALREVSLDVQEGEILVLVGPSGCGKSTLLNLTAGFLASSAGAVFYRGEPIQGINTRVGYMTQEDNLLPWRRVAGNIQLPLEIQAAADQARRVADYIKLVNLEGFEQHYPKELSGGMRKRVALARALISDPETLLMDEPFGSLDAQLKLVMQNELLKVLDLSIRKTLVFVTHDLGEAVALGDRVVVFTGRPGRIKAIEKVPLPRPRDVFKVRFSREYEEVYNRLWRALEEEVYKGEAL
ncbi:MAG: ABC transporter ATP-binding protein [Deltaproteobacteria bacterium]|nr:ABC transporter ATP-binding protein [Deltaproteobacteria bacterium]